VTGSTVVGSPDGDRLETMPTRSSGNLPGGTISDLGLPGRAVTALTRAGVTRVEDLAALSRRELTAISGLGPGLVAAIRLVVPEPPAPVTRPGPTAIPSFESLRSPQRRSAVDLLLPGPPPESSLPESSVPEPSVPEPSVPESSVPEPSGPEPSGPEPARAGAPRPAEYADLLRLGRRLLHAAPGWMWASVCGPARRLRRLLSP
jgi:hypothetical protein